MEVDLRTASIRSFTVVPDAFPIHFRSRPRLLLPPGSSTRIRSDADTLSSTIAPGVDVLFIRPISPLYTSCRTRRVQLPAMQTIHIASWWVSSGALKKICEGFRDGGEDPEISHVQSGRCRTAGISPDRRVRKRGRAIQKRRTPILGKSNVTTPLHKGVAPHSHRTAGIWAVSSCSPPVIQRFTRLPGFFVYH